MLVPYSGCLMVPLPNCAVSLRHNRQQDALEGVHFGLGRASVGIAQVAFDQLGAFVGITQPTLRDDALDKAHLETRNGIDGLADPAEHEEQEAEDWDFPQCHMRATGDAQQGFGDRDAQFQRRQHEGDVGADCQEQDRAQGTFHCMLGGVGGELRFLAI